MIRGRSWVAAGILAIGLIAGAAHATELGGGEPSVELVQERRDLMRGIGSSMTVITRYVRGESGDLSEVAAQADRIAESAARIPSLFPAGSGADQGFDTGALPTIWEQPDRFIEVAGILEARATDLGDMARAGDEDGVRTAMERFAQQSCAVCHGTFRAPR